jgi:hypothetical protein
LCPRQHLLRVAQMCQHGSGWSGWCSLILFIGCVGCLLSFFSYFLWRLGGCFVIGLEIDV